MSINRVVISGNLTRDAELRQTAGGMSVLSFGIAVNDRRQNPTSGEWENVPNFIDCTVFGKRAEALERFLLKGTGVAIEGKLRYSSWENKEDGKRRSKIEVIVDALEFMGSANNANSNAGANSGASATQAVRETEIPPAPEVTVYDEDIPF